MDRQMIRNIDALNDLLDGRYSCRGFLKDEVPQGTIEAIVRTGRKSPRCNSQPWQLSICAPDTTKELALTEAAKGGMHAPDVTLNVIGAFIKSVAHLRLAAL